MTLRQRARQYFTPGFGLLTWLMATMMVFFVVTNVIEAKWLRGFQPMRGVAVTGCVVAALLARWRSLPAALAHLLSLVLALVWATLQIQLDPILATFGDRSSEMIIRAIVAIREIKNGAAPEDYYLFSMGGLLLAWLLGYSTIWLLMRRGWLWRIVLINGGLIMVNLTYALPKSKPSFWFFVISTLALLVFETFRVRQRNWDEGALEQQEWLSLRYLWAGLMACVFLVVAAAVLPSSITNAQLRLLGDRLSQPFDFIQRALNLPGAGESFTVAVAPPPTRANFANATVSLGGARVATNAVVLEVRSSRPEYWRSNSWDFYNGSGWENTTGELARQVRGTSTKREALTPLGAGNQLLQLDVAGRQVLTQTITLVQERADQQLPAATSPLTWSVPVLVQHSFIITAGQPPLPNFSDGTIYFNQGQVTAGFTYTVVSLVSSADKQSLREASTDYPFWTRRYTQLPESPAIRQIDALSRQLAAGAGAESAFDKAVAFEAYLRSMPYDDQIPPAPPGTDPIANFLFNLKRGYCDYFAGAMVLMLRTQGIPARWVQGYATGEFDPERGVYVVRDTIAHSWPEVYFTGYGWQRFEPTPAGYVTVPARPEIPPDQAIFPEDDIGPNGGIVHQIPTQPDFEELDDLKNALADQGPAPTPQAGSLPPEEIPYVEPRVWPAWLRALLWFLAFAGVAALAVWSFIRRETRGLMPAARAYALVGMFARWAGIEQGAERTPREYVDDLSRQLPGKKKRIVRLADAYTHEQYSAAGRVDIDQVREDSRDVARPLLIRAARRAGRTLAETLLRNRRKRTK